MKFVTKIFEENINLRPRNKKQKKSNIFKQYYLSIKY